MSLSENNNNVETKIKIKRTRISKKALALAAAAAAAASEVESVPIATEAPATTTTLEQALLIEPQTHNNIQQIITPLPFKEEEDNEIIDNTEIIARYNNGNKTEDYNIEYRKKDDYNYSKK